MKEDKWFRLINDDIADIPARVHELKAEYCKKLILFALLIVGGSLTMGVAQSTGAVAIGGFMATTGIVGIMAMATMCHTQLCLYRALKELREMNRPTGEQPPERGEEGSALST